jgi:hypothetical protein
LDTYKIYSKKNPNNSSPNGRYVPGAQSALLTTSNGVGKAMYYKLLYEIKNHNRYSYKYLNN